MLAQEGIRSQGLLGELSLALLSRMEETVVIVNGDVDTQDGPTIEFVNPAAQKRIGLPEHELVGRALGKIVKPREWPAILKQLRTINETHQSARLDVPAEDQNGREYWMEISTVPLMGEDGRVRHFARIGRDVTTRKQAEQQRETTQRLLASVFGVMDSPLIVTNHVGTIIMVNAALSRQLGWSVFDAIGKHISDLVGDSDQDAVARLVSDPEAGEEERRLGNVTLLHHSGPPVAGSLRLTLVKHPDSQDYVVIKADVNGSAQEEAGRSLDQAIRQSIARTQGGPVIAGKLQLVGLNALREELGARWPEISERVFVIAEQVIRKYLQPGDICQRSGADGFLVFFDRLTESEAQAKARMIGAEIRQRLTGELPEAAAMELSSYAASVTIDPAGALGEESLLDLLNGRIEKKRQSMESAAREAVAAALRNSRVLFRTAETTQRKPAPLTFARLPSDLQDAIDTMLSLGQSAYALEADAFLLAGAGQRLLTEVTRRDSGLVVAPVRFSTISRPRDFEAWLKIARTMGEARNSRMVIEVTEIPREVIRSRLADLAMRLAPLVRTTAFELPVSEASFAMGLPISTRLATISASHLINRNGVSVATVERLVRLLETRQCRLIVKDWASPDHLAPLAEAGIPLILSELSPDP